MIRKLCGRLVLATLAVSLAAGCENNGSGEAPVSADLAGDWTGQYLSPGHSEAVTAKITQDGSSLVIETSKDGHGHLLAGMISQNGDIAAMDAFTGKTWTSLGTITSNHIFIRDYLTANLGEAGGVQALDLSR